MLSLNYTLQSLLKKQDIFETEVKVHTERASEIEVDGKELMDQVHASILSFLLEEEHDFFWSCRATIRVKASAKDSVD